MPIKLSDEQMDFITKALQGKNILVEACIGSGKTSSIQELCNQLKNKNILYLTYNRLLKLDAKSKIKNKNVEVQNYHGLAYRILGISGIKCGVQDLVRTFNMARPPFDKHYDVLILDEYQDIDEDIANMLLYIQEVFPDIQIIAVGDMDQKIYDYTSLDVWEFIKAFLGDFEQIAFTHCFRLNADFAKTLGDTWGKPIIGVNNNCTVSFKTQDEVYKLLCKLQPKDILCLGKQNGDMVSILNRLEYEERSRFNKRTVYASIKNVDKGQVDPTNNVAIFTTYDSSKGMERDTCIVFDFDFGYWNIRKNMANTRYKILRNIFLVAASRGKRNVIFCTNDKPLTFEEIAKPFDESLKYTKFDMSSMFDFKFKEDVDKAFRELEIKEIEMKDKSEIHIKSSDGLIDMSPCIGIFTEACYFKNYDIDKTLQFQWSHHASKYNKKEAEIISQEDLMNKIRYVTYLATDQRRYYSQSRHKFVSEEDAEKIKDRLKTLLPDDCDTQKPCSLACKYKDAKGNEQKIEIHGLTDEINDGVIYEMKFVDELSHEHFLQLASYMAALNKDVGRIWNVRYNKLFEVRIKDRQTFLNKVMQAITKGTIKEFIPFEMETVL